MVLSVAGLFDSAWLKWGWAVREAEALKHDLRAFGDDAGLQRLNTARCDYNPQRHGFILTVSGMAPIPPEIGLRLSTVAHSYRSCMDNLAWALVTRGSTPPEKLAKRARRAIAFPLCESRVDFNLCRAGTKRRPARLPGVKRADLAVIRACQPFHYGKSKRPYHTLSILAKFNNLDKHQSIQPVLFLPERLHYKITDHADCEITQTALKARRRVLEIGAELARFPARRTGPDPRLKVEYELVVLPAVNETLALSEWLTKLHQLIASVLATFSPPPRAEFEHLGLPHRIELVQ